ncbi:MAG: hypothetical protein H7249_01375 [Chitinophagaceae bacterium]|nr:hypothetical protein [Oligoflexus sp.]
MFVKNASMFFGLISLALACTGKNESVSDNRAYESLAFFQTTPQIELEVWYEPEAAPYSDDDWNILNINLNAIFQYRSTPPTLIIPSTLSAMHTLEAQNRDGWTSSEILSLAAAHSTAAMAAHGSRFKIIFLNSYLRDDTGINKSVLGVSIGDSHVLAMFKPVIASTKKALPLDKTAQQVEQVVLVHEMGHALGFVNNGVPMVNNYQDTAHGAHSINKDCVMYWANESSTDLTSYVGKFLGGGAKVLWGPEVLVDAKAISK